MIKKIIKNSITNIKKIDIPLLIVSILLFSFGLIMIYSSSDVSSFMRYSKPTYWFFIKQAAALLIGIVAFFIIIQMKTKTIYGLTWCVYIISIILMLIAYFSGNVVNGSRGWLNLKVISIQPSEFAKVLMILWISTFYAKNKKNFANNKTTGFLWFFIIITAGIVVIQNDFGTALVIGLVGLIMYLLMPLGIINKSKTLIVLLVVATIGLGGYYIFNTSGFQSKIERFDYKYPCNEEKFYDEGNQVCNSYIAFNNGGMNGKGLGNSTQKYLYLPESHTDFIFAIVVEEMGFWKSSLVILAILFVMYRIVCIGNRSKNSRDRLTCYGISTYIFLHMTFNLLGIMGMIPLTGVPLPFISYGGSFALSLCCAISVVQRIEIENKIANEVV